jgi:hypothetical protein
VTLLGMLRGRRVLTHSSGKTVHVALFVNDVASLITVAVLRQVNGAIANRTSNFLTHSNLWEGAYSKIQLRHYIAAPNEEQSRKIKVEKIR